ncbi:MAG: hypothetical protein H6969_06765 [Gammaproteobacteria bacterium]|nr:hypothetical protein [Gammaproteobacteria bacterium]
MKNKRLNIVLLFLIVGSSYFSWRSFDQSVVDESKTVINFQEEINNKVSQAKGSFYWAASEYINTIKRFNDEIVQKKMGNEIRESVCPAIEGGTNQSCPPSLPVLNLPSSIYAIEDASAKLAVSVSQFQIDIRNIRYQACKEVGYLCLRNHDDLSFHDLWKDLPSTEFDKTILEAIALLPKTHLIVEQILAQY